MNERKCPRLESKQRGAWIRFGVVEKIRERTKKGEDGIEGWQRIYTILFPFDKTIPSPCEYFIACALIGSTTYILCRH